MAWLVSEGRVLATADVAQGRAAKRRGLLGRDTFEGAFVLERCRWVHTIGMRFAIDVAHLDAQGRVLATTCMRPWRVGRPVRHATCVVEAAAGAFARWDLRPGMTIEIRE